MTINRFLLFSSVLIFLFSFRGDSGNTTEIRTKGFYYSEGKKKGSAIPSMELMRFYPDNQLIYGFFMSMSSFNIMTLKDEDFSRNNNDLIEYTLKDEKTIYFEIRIKGGTMRKNTGVVGKNAIDLQVETVNANDSVIGRDSARFLFQPY